MSESLNLWQRMNNVMMEVGKVSRDKFIQLNSSGAGYKAVTHDNVTSTIRPALVKNGVFVSVDQTDCKVETIEITKKGFKGAPDYIVNEYMATVYIEVTFFNVEKPDEQIKSKGFAYAMDSSDKAPGKALSYAVKNVLLKNLMLESCDEEENRGFEQRNNYEPALINKGSYVLTAGKQKGVKVVDLSEGDLRSFLNWIDGEDQKKPVTGALKNDFLALKAEYKKRGLK